MAGDGSCAGAKRLIAILFVTRSRPGPKLVFHYPPDPQLKSTYIVDRDSDSDDESDTDHGSAKPALVSFAGLSTTTETHASSDLNDGGQTKSQFDPDNVLGFSEESLAKLLSPGCWCDRKKFEICLDAMTFLGHPIHADHDGSWARKHTHAPESNTLPSTRSKAARIESNEHDDDSQMQLGITVTEPQTPIQPVHDFKHVAESFDSHVGSLATSINSTSTTSAVVVPEQLTSFHVILVLANDAKEPNRQGRPGDTTDVYYQNVVKTLSKALHYCQNQSSYVGVESKKLLSTKTKAKQSGSNSFHLCEQMLETSELAWALKEVYEKLSIGEIAGVRLEGAQLSLQLPAHDKASDPHDTVQLDDSAALLLLEDKDVLLRDLAHPESSPLAYYIREQAPTKSLQKQAAKFGMAIDDILYLARHLIKWRKARAVTPLHPRNTYVVGPVAPLDRISQYGTEYSRRFPALPTLPQVLKILSGKPIKYGMLIPSRDHRSPYMDILAYLVRYGFAQQLKTFGWLQAPLETRSSEPEPSINKNRSPLSVASLLSPQLRPADDDAASISSERTAIPVSTIDHTKNTNGAQSSPLQVPVAGSDDVDDAKIILNPSDMSAEDSQRFTHIRDSLDDGELSDRLPSLLQYLDGETALEDIAAIEGLKRSKVEIWFDQLQRLGYLVTFRRA